MKLAATPAGDGFRLNLKLEAHQRILTVAASVSGVSLIGPFARQVEEGDVVFADSASGPSGNEAAHLGEEPFALFRFHELMIGCSPHKSHMFVGSELL